MKVEIEFIESSSTETQWSGWKVTYGEKYADGLTYDEMLGLVAAITLPKKRPTLQRLKTALEIGLNESNLFDCHVSYSFRIFQNKTTKELHIYYK